MNGLSLTEAASERKENLTSHKATRTEARSADDFDWDDTVVTVIPEQPQTAVYTNADGQVVVRQHCWPDGDDLVLISPSYAIMVALAILRAAGHNDVEFVRACGGGGYEDVEVPELPQRRSVEKLTAARPDIDWGKVNADFNKFESGPKDPKAAERQRRRREKLRDSHGKSVTAERDTVTSAVTPCALPIAPRVLKEEVKNLALAR
ncbi:hypothetical protein [Bradyrhizobium mercantei]|uniref:hypothetical protein n=1 Tax=Bradyrhizobium mercantei TaxID=1904807 RepID=UPI000975F245|nr:hypothetical protein [Bradyrhizobium mercantei]